MHGSHWRRWRRSALAPQRARARDLELAADLLARQLARASRSAISAVRAWNTSALTFSGGHPITVDDLRWLRSPSSDSTSAPRWSSGKRREVGHQLAQIGAALDVVGQAVERRLDLVDRHGGVAARGEQRAAAVAGDREQPRPHRVRHAARLSARCARTKVCWSASSPSSRLPTMWRQKASSAAWWRS